MADQSDASGKDAAGDGEYKVGRGRPPKHSQWQPGESGNKKGKGKGVEDWADVIRDVLEEVVTVTEGGKTKRLTRQRVLAKTIYNKAVQGDLRAAQLLIEKSSRAANDNQNPFEGLNPAVIASFIARYLKQQEPGDDE